MSMNVASELRDRLDTFDEYLSTLGNKKKETSCSVIIYQIFSSFKVNRIQIINNQVKMAVFVRYLFHAMIENIIWI